MFLIVFFITFAQADVSVTIVNNTRFELDIGKEVMPYMANEVTLNPHDFGNALGKNKFRFGIRHQANDYIKLDPHVFLQHQRKNNWKLEYGPTLRIDVNF